MSEEPDTHELTRRVNHCENLFDELQKVVASILAWKEKICGGLSVMIWVIGGIQSVVLICLGLAANSLNHTAETLGRHAVELATTRTQMDAFMGHGPRFTTEANDLADAKLKEWVRQEIKSNNQTANQ